MEATTELDVLRAGKESPIAARWESTQALQRQWCQLLVSVDAPGLNELLWLHMAARLSLCLCFVEFPVLVFFFFFWGGGVVLFVFSRFYFFVVFLFCLCFVFLVLLFFLFFFFLLFRFFLFLCWLFFFVFFFFLLFFFWGGGEFSLTWQP